MLAPSTLPEKFAVWNRVHGAPFGRDRLRHKILEHFYSREALQRLRGPFAIQSNNTTRTYEYPWAYYAAELTVPKRIVEIGGSRSGLQFVLSREGHEVTNVDPGVGWPLDEERIRELNSWFNSSVALKNCTIGKANLPDNYYDLFLSVSVIEHLDEQDIQEVMENAYRCLKPGGRFVITLDLFLNIEPFSRRASNEIGKNQNVRRMVDISRMKLVSGERSQLFGYPEFDPEAIIASLEKYLIGIHYPVLTQCIILEKP
jgi:2-polyprenyl-3-methyl-5-hydroxy-6-metoxy-1,4-benzoquinol methylase